MSDEIEVGPDSENGWDERLLLAPADRVPRRVVDLQLAGEVL